MTESNVEKLLENCRKRFPYFHILLSTLVRTYHHVNATLKSDSTVVYSTPSFSSDEEAIADLTKRLENPQRQNTVGSFQGRTTEWSKVCLGEGVLYNKDERNHRLLEESLEIVQAAGCTRSEAHQLVDYVFSRPVGDLPQEIGGVMNCLALLCTAHDLDMMKCAEDELDRVWQIIEKIRIKRTTKPTFVPIPEHVGFYEREFYPLSNFSSFRLMWKGIDFDTSEIAYHWEKFPDRPDIQWLLLKARSSHDAYKVAADNKAHRRPDWDNVKISIMMSIIWEKVSQHEYVRKKLLETGDRLLVEDSWRDDYWGWGPNKDGQNVLGMVWRSVRDILNTSASDLMKQYHAAKQSGTNNE